jgi:aquaporin Z
MKKYLVEFIGTFFLVLAVCMAGTTAGAMAPLAIGATLMVMVYAGGYVSGGHYNPAVSLAVCIRGKLPVMEMVIYWVVQLAGAAAAAYIASHVFMYGASAHGNDFPKREIAAEMLGTFALAYVVLNTATSAKTAGNSNYGLAIGFTVVAMAYILGPVSGGAFNTAVAFGNSIFGGFSWSAFWVYVTGTLVGGAVAGFVYKFINPDAD